MKRINLIMLLVSLVGLHANDGAYTMSGTQLTPIHESNISIKKEVLIIKLLENEESILDVTVEYTFFNPHKSKNVLVGFEADEPYGDVTRSPKNGEHPYMKLFSVEVNNEKIPYKVFYDEIYVYSFDATFKKGVNHITHHYRYEPSGSVMNNFEIDYILSAASRWAGNRIEDFTLIIDVGDFKQFTIANTFFKSAKEWVVNGITRQSVYIYDMPKNEQTSATRFYVKHSPIVFKKKNFLIEGELHLLSERHYANFYDYGEYFDDGSMYLPFNIANFYLEYKFPLSRRSYKIYRNLPYAREGYVFKNKNIQKYFEQLDWYQKNPKYKIGKKEISTKEKELYEEFDRISLKMLQNLPFAHRGYRFKDANLNFYFQHQNFYIEDSKYIPSISELPKKEKAWLLKAKALTIEEIKDVYTFVDEYDAIYNNCLHKHEKAKVNDFMRRLFLMDKQGIKHRFSKKNYNKIDGTLIDTIFSEKTNHYELVLQEDKKDRGCYEYRYNYTNTKGEYSFFIGVGKENGAFKIVLLELAG